ncbi:double zinc ribbon domain-containing protein [Flavobacterium sp. SLB02]
MFNYIIDLFFPKVCAGCHTILVSNENVFCTNCHHELPLIQYHLD